MKSTPKKRKPLRHGAISFTGDRRRRRDRSRGAGQAPGQASPPAADAVESAPVEVEAEHRRAASPRVDEARDDQRLQKVLAAAGVGSRRECEELILAGRVEVDGRCVTELGVRVDSRNQKITVDGEPIKFQRRTYFAVNKPTGVLSTNRDPAGRIRVVDLIGGEQRLFTVGRLDQHSDGLIIVTNDGELTQRLTHPRYGVPKTYSVQVAGAATGDVIAKLLAGVHLEEGIAKAARAFIRKRHKNHTVLEMVLTEGRNREIRRMLAQLGHKVQRLTRIAVGPVRLGKLKPGQSRPLESWETKALKELAFRPGGAGPKRAPRGKPFDRDKLKPRREKPVLATPPSSDESVSPQESRPPRPGKARPAKPPRREFGARSVGAKRPSEKKFGEKKFGEKRFGEKKIGKQRFAEPPAGEKRYGKRLGKRPPWSKDAVQGAAKATTGDSHPLPFLKQGLVVEDDAPVVSRPPRPLERKRKKPLRRLNVRRK